MTVGLTTGDPRDHRVQCRSLRAKGAGPSAGDLSDSSCLGQIVPKRVCPFEIQARRIPGVVENDDASAVDRGVALRPGDLDEPDVRGNTWVSMVVRVDSHSLPVCAVIRASSSSSKSRLVGSSNQRNRIEVESALAAAADSRVCVGGFTCGCVGLASAVDV